MLEPVHLRELLVEPASHPRAQPHLSAASGLALVGSWLYTVADDEHHLGRFASAMGNSGPVQLHRLLPGDLPHGKSERKKHKPDLEALALLPSDGGHPNGELLALGSGSRPNRERACVVNLDINGLPAGEARNMDLSGLYQPLRLSFPDLNIEGAFVCGPHFHLLQRGNKGDARNACIVYALAQVQDWVAGRRDTPPPALQTLPFALGALDGAPLSFTDGVALPGGGWMFSAVAEDTSDSYHDGRCAGSALGWVDGQGRLLRIEQIVGAPKVEGIALAGEHRLLMVTDADDPGQASQLLSLALP